jgi:predicted NAD/FAD-binding protein
VFEADDRLGGHANTVTVTDPDAGPLGVDTGFIVHNDRNYPNLIRLFDDLGVATQESEMSFGVEDRATGFAYRATNPATLLARPANALDPRLWKMLVDIARFFRHGRRFLANPEPDLTIGEFLERGRYSDAFLHLHLLPMGAAVWSTSPDDFADFPAESLLRFLDNHGLLTVGDRPQWRTVTGGSRSYVAALADRFEGRILTGRPVEAVRPATEGSAAPSPGRGPIGQVQVTTAAGVEDFDVVILACHSDQARKLLADCDRATDEVLSAIAYRDNTAVLHTDVSFLPRHRRAWAAWNYHAGPDGSTPTLTYDLTTLQRLPGRHRYLVTINPDRQPDGEIARFDYAHPQYTVDALAAQRRFDEIDGRGGVHFCGAYWGYGFHEDGMASALRVVAKLGVQW